MDSVWDHKSHESKMYSLWEESGNFTPIRDKSKKPFTIIMPPPNANDSLHIGHTRFVAIQDAIIRYCRMKGFSALWLPGADHAGIETQFVFEKKLKAEGKSRSDFNRTTLYKMLMEFSLANKKNMEEQLKALGASCDWSRNKFTLDEDIIKIVYKTFKKLYDDRLIYRGERIVNYCPRCGTSYSQLEVDSQEQEDGLYYINYGTIKIATTRPETIFADVAVAVNPKDNRFKSLIGKNATIPLVNREIPIIADSTVDTKFGTGALKITPGHDSVDFEIGQRHKLFTISVIDSTGRMINTPEKYIGMKALDSREEVVKDLYAVGAITKIEKIKHVVGVCYKDKGLIEPMVSKQWFLQVAPLVKTAIQSIKDKRVIFTSKKFEKIAKHWLTNLRDWNISRQIVWGIRIPAWKCDGCGEWTVTEGATPSECASCNGKNLTQDSDTFDTWFSSGQWPFATLSTTQKGDLEYFYPTSVMETAYDILPFWVIRMIMLGLYTQKDVPFKEVLIHGLVRDKDGQKISKSKGNVINPMEMIEKYGADAVRMGLLWGTLVENDVALSEDNIRGQRNFSNKIWNIARFVFMEKTGQKTKLNADDKKIKLELKKTVKLVDSKMKKYRLNEAAEILYNFIWNDFANIYLGKTKLRRPDAQKTLEFVLQESLKMLHPLMPFVTEAVWQEGKDRFDSPTLISAAWPK